MSEGLVFVTSQIAYAAVCIAAAWHLRTKTWTALSLTPLLLISWAWWYNSGFPVPPNSADDPFGLNFRIRIALQFSFLCLALSTAIGCCVIVARSRRRFD